MMNAKRKGKREHETVRLGDEPDPDPTGGAAGAQDYDPARPHLRPGQASEHPHQDRDDELDSDYRAAQGGTAGSAAKPGVETVESGRVPGAGDPQNGVMTPPGKSPIAWADTSRDVAQHYPLAEDGSAAQDNAPVD
jgi:hypothetical protein